MNIKPLNYNTLKKVYYTAKYVPDTGMIKPSIPVIYDITKRITSDDSSKYIAVNDKTEYTPKKNEIPFVPEYFDVSCYSIQIVGRPPHENIEFLWNKRLYLDSLILKGDEVSDIELCIFKPNPDHNKLNFSESDPEYYYEVLRDYYQTQIIERFVNGESLKSIYNSLPIYFKSKEFPPNPQTATIFKYIRYEITLTTGDEVLTFDDISTGLYLTNNFDNIELAMTDELANNLEEFIINKYKNMINNDLKKIGYDKECSDIILIE